MIEWEQCSNKLDQSLVLTLCWCPFGLKAYSWTQKKLAVILHTCNITYERTVTNEYKVQAKFPFRIISRLHYHKWAHSTSRFVWKALFLTSLQTSHKSCQQYINESKFLIRLPLMKGMFDARKNFCIPMYFDLSVYSKATPTPSTKS